MHQEAATGGVMFFCEFYKISKNTFSTEHLWTTASVHLRTTHLVTMRNSTLFLEVSAYHSQITCF